MNKEHPYILPVKQKGIRAEILTFRVSKHFKAYLKIFTEQEKEKHQANISQATIVQNLMTQNSLQMIEKRNEFIQGFREYMKKENHHANKNTPNPADLY